MSPLAAALALAQADPHAGHAMPAPATTARPADPHVGHGVPALPVMADPHAAHRAAAPSGEVGNAPPPPPPIDHAADADWDPRAMAAARAQLREEHGGGTYHLVSIPILEYQARDGRDGLRWEGEAWYGSDYWRAVVRSEGEAVRGGGLAEGEAQALVSRPIDAYWDLRAGVRRDFARGPDRTYAVLSAEGLAPYWFEVTGSLFLSHRGELSARAEASYDQRLTQRITLQPRIELNLSAEDVPGRGIGSGLVEGEAELRLSYQIARELRPYVGLSYQRQFGETRRLSRAAGDKAQGTNVVVGMAVFF